MLVPGFVNAHTHLELPRLSTVPGLGLPAWVRTMRVNEGPSRATADANLAEALALGTASVLDVGNTRHGADALDALGATSTGLREVLGIDQPELPAEKAHFTPHAPYSVHPDAITACVARSARDRTVISIHCDEDPAERQFLLDGSGPWRDFAIARGRDVSQWRAPGLSPVRYLDALGALSPRTVLVHCTLTPGDELDLIAERGCPVAVCPRSNMHIVGRLPDVPGMIRRGIPVLIGSDSLASTPDLDLLAEVAALRRAFPQVALDTWLHALSFGAVAALRLPYSARFGWGALDVESDGIDELFNGTRWPRSWLA